VTEEKQIRNSESRIQNSESGNPNPESKTQNSESGTRLDRKPARSFTDLIVWQRAHALVLEIYRHSEGFPTHEVNGLRSQIRSSGTSVPANIAEAFRKRSPRDKVRVLNIVQSSLEETRYHAILAFDLGYLKTDLMPQVDEVGRLLDAYVASILQSPRWP